MLIWLVLMILIWAVLHVFLIMILLFSIAKGLGLLEVSWYICLANMFSFSSYGCLILTMILSFSPVKGLGLSSFVEVCMDSDNDNSISPSNSQVREAGSVVDPYHFDLDPDQRIRIRLWIRIRPKIQVIRKCQLFFFIFFQSLLIIPTENKWFIFKNNLIFF